MFLGARELGVEALVEIEERERTRELVGAAKAFELALRRLHAVVGTLDPKGGRDTDEELGLLEGFTYVSVGADLDRLDAALRVRLREDEGDGNELIAEPTDRSTGIDARHARHDGIEKGDIDATLRDALDAFLSVLRGLDLVAALAQRRRDEIARRRVVIGDEHAGRTVVLEGGRARASRERRSERRTQHG